MAIDTDLDVDAYFNPTLKEDFDKISEAIKILNENMLNIATDMQVAAPDNDILTEFGGLCVEISDSIDEMCKMIEKTKKQLADIEQIHITSI